MNTINTELVLKLAKIKRVGRREGELDFPIDRGIVTNWDDMELVSWFFCFYFSHN